MLIGVDVSHHQKEVDWYQTRQAGARFAFVRAGSCTSVSGVCYTDHQFERNAALAPEYMPIGFYWYFRPNKAPIKQAEYFCSLIKGRRWLLPPVMDLESKGEDQTPYDITIAASKFATRVHDRLKVWPLLYSRSGWLNSNTVPHVIWEKLAYWVARYKDLDHPWGDGDYIPAYYLDWLFWQFSARGNGRGAEFGAQSKSIDLDYFNGDQAAFDAVFGEISPLVQVSANWAVSLRAGPTGPAIGATWNGSTWPVLGVSEDGNYYRVEAWLKKNTVKEI